TNAIKFSFPGSVITISVVINDKEVAISISDQGTGMDEETIQKLFRPDVFHSTHGTNHERGTGLGLILVKELIEKQNGRITVKSKPAEGSTFTFTLPVAV
ncbi:MAG: ATP-binding protein, partial [Chlorobiota bacterium]